MSANSIRYPSSCIQVSRPHSASPAGASRANSIRWVYHICQQAPLTHLLLLARRLFSLLLYLQICLVARSLAQMRIRLAYMSAGLTHLLLLALLRFSLLLFIFLFLSLSLSLSRSPSLSPSRLLSISFTSFFFCNQSNDTDARNLPRHCLRSTLRQQRTCSVHCLVWPLCCWSPTHHAHTHTQTHTHTQQALSTVIY